MNIIDKNNELRVKAQAGLFGSEIKELRNVAKEHHVLFVQDVMKVCEDVNQKIEEIKVDVSKEMNTLTTNYSLILSKVYIIAGAITNFIQTFQSTIPSIEAKDKEDRAQFGQLKVLLGELKEVVSNPAPQSFLTPEFLTQKLHGLDQAIQKAVAPITKFANMLPTGAPPVVTGVQGGEKKVQTM